MFNMLRSDVSSNLTISWQNISIYNKYTTNPLSYNATRMKSVRTSTSLFQFQVQGFTAINTNGIILVHSPCKFKHVQFQLQRDLYTDVGIQVSPLTTYSLHHGHRKLSLCSLVIHILVISSFLLYCTPSYITHHVCVHPVSVNIVMQYVRRGFRKTR